ncbi:Synaptotagmin-14 [Cricetulus griseus]|uniref:Synaptotagmin-14 n=1 Tax=Cricetulus griseus TaxID=10029 RepID=G3HZ08_CRIGR|nr:Synaptotagmin-14 [Cricetulus griseus]
MRHHTEKLRVTSSGRYVKAGVVLGVDFHPAGSHLWYVTPEAIGFLSAIGVFVVLLAVLALFINKKLCFETIRGRPHLEQRGKRKQSLREKTGDHTGPDP